MKFSVLISVYIRENPEFFARAMKSIWDDQTLKPDEIVLILDGSLTQELDDVVKYYQTHIGDILNVVALEKNMGLSNALKIGVLKCKYDLIARMDSDDVSLPHRFEKQIHFLETHSDIDVVGGFITEFEKDESIITSTRTLPTNSDELSDFARKRCPLNHVTVMMKKPKLLEAGNYQEFLGIEDYYVWPRMLICGAKLANIADVLVNVRAGQAMISRRGGWKYAITEFQLQKKFLQMGFINYYEFVRNVTIRFIVRVVPSFIRQLAYKAFR